MVTVLMRSPYFTASLLFSLLAVVCCSIQGDVSAQLKLGFPARVPVESGTKPESIQDDLFPGKAPLNTSNELQRAMNKAAEAASKGQYEVAVEYWSRLLKKIDITLMSRKGETARTTRHAYRKYLLARFEVEQAIRHLPPEGLQFYRDKVDNDASAFYKDRLEGDPVVALEKVVSYYFLSSYGDDAAFKLANLYADRGDFSKAASLLERLVNDYPDATVSKSSVLMLLSLTYAQSGDAPRAERTFLKAKQATGSKEMIARVDSAIKHSNSVTNQSSFALGNWEMRLGNATRRGLMIDPNFEWTSKPLTSLWDHSFGDIERGTSGLTEIASTPHSLTPNRNQDPFGGGGGFFNAKLGMMGRAYPSSSSSTTLASLDQSRKNSARWKQLEVTPACQMLMSDGLVFYKADRRLVCCDSKTGKVKWMGRPNQLYSSTAINRVYRRTPTTTPTSTENVSPVHQLTSAQEQFLFADRIKHSMSIADDLILNIEGEFLGHGGEAQIAVQKPQPYNRYGTQWRGQTNWLSAYELTTGKLKWHRSAIEDNITEVDSKVGFLASPVPYGKSLLVPVSKQGGVWLYSLSRTSGKTEWKSLLCEAPQGAVSAWSPVGTSVEGGDVYVATGEGVLFALDARTGTIRWSIRYQRSGQAPHSVNRFQPQSYSTLKGWDEDIIIPYGHLLVVIPSDYQYIFAIDRAAGRIQWESPQTPVPGDSATFYCLGVVDHHLYLASSKVVRCYNMAGGRLEWEQSFSGSVGRGFLTQKYLYLPVKNDVVKFHRLTGKEIARRGVYTAVNEPLGNLFSNGEHLFVTSPGRIYSVTSMEGHLQRLAKRIDEGDPSACWDRMKLRYRMEKTDDAIADLNRMILLMQKHPNYNALAINQKIQEAISMMKLESVKPMLTFDLLLESNQRIQKETATISASQLQYRDRLLSAAFTHALLKEQVAKKLRTENSTEFTTKMIEVATLCKSSYILTMAEATLKKTINETDIPVLTSALKSNQPVQRRIAIDVLLSKEGLKFQQQTQLVPAMIVMMDDSDNHVQLAATSYLILQKERRAVQTLVQLLESEHINIRAKSIGLLRGMTGANKKYFAYKKPADQTVAIAAWKKWYQEEGQMAKLDFTASIAAELGRTLIAYGSSRTAKVVEYDSAGNQTWSINTQYLSACIGLSNGHRLISNYRTRVIDEYDASGKKIWTLTGTSGTVVSLQRLPNGNTLVCSNNALKEYSPDKSVVWSYQKSGTYLRNASRLTNGNTLLTLYSKKKVIEVDPKGKTVWEMPLTFNPYCSQRLENGNTIVCDYRKKTIHEYDTSKKKVFSMTTTQKMTQIQRLSNGNTFLMSSRGAYEYSPTGKMIWSKTFSNVRSAHRF